MIVGIILALLFGIGGLYYMVQLAGATPAIIETIMGPFNLAVERVFTLMGGLAPFFVALIPLYIVVNSRAQIKDKDRLIAFSAIYGLALYGLAVFTGLDTTLTQAMRGSMSSLPFVGSTIGAAVSTMGALASWIIAILTGFLLWGTGLALVVIEGALDALVGVGEAAKRGRTGVRGAQRSILERIGGQR